FGKDHAKAVWDAGRAAIDQIATNIRDERIKCDFRWVPGYLHAPLGEQRKNERELLARDAELANEFGFSAAFLESVPSFPVPGVRFDHQAKFHPRKYLAGLLKSLPGPGTYLFEKSEAAEVQEKPLAIKVRSHRIKCRYVI